MARYVKRHALEEFVPRLKAVREMGSMREKGEQFQVGS
jgi:hypothetical protein